MTRTQQLEQALNEAKACQQYLELAKERPELPIPKGLLDKCEKVLLTMQKIISEKQ